MRIHFFQPEQFNRTENKTNPFFDPLIEVCQHNNIPYKVFIAEKQQTRNGYGNKAGNSWNLVLPEILGFRLIKWFQLPSRLVWYIAGFIMNILTLGKYRADICITVAGIHLEILQGIAPKARLVDLQHGVIFPHHTGYFDSKGILQPLLQKSPQREYWLYGPGFKNIFFSNPENARFLNGKLHIVGALLQRETLKPQNHRFSSRCNELIISLQFKPDMSPYVNQKLKDSLNIFLAKHKELFIKNNIKVFLRHHPRFNNVVNLEDIYKDYPFLTELDRTEIYNVGHVFCHVAWTSTTVFEYTKAGIPTVFLSEESLYDNGIFGKYYKYPAPNLSVADILDFNDEQYAEHAAKLTEWYTRFYSSFDELNILKILTYTSEKDS